MANRRFFIGLLVALCLALPCGAATLSGRASVSTYLWEYTEADSSGTRHVQNTGTLSLRLARIGNQDLEISTSLRGRYDVRNAGDNVHDYHVYNLQARWKNIGRVADLTAGRQRVFWPTGSVSIDGAAGAVRPIRGLEIGGYAGSTAPDDGRFKVTDFDDGHAFGGQVRYTKPGIGQAALSFAQRNRARSYEDISVNSLAARTLGLDWRRTIERFGSAYGQVNYDMLRERVGRAHFSLRWRATEIVALSGQFRYRRPSLPYNSIFWVFGDAKSWEGRLRADWRLNDIWSVNGGVAFVDLGEDDAQRFDFGISHRYFNATIHGKTGGAGSTIGVSGDAIYPVNDRWLLRAGSRLFSFELDEDAEESNFELSSWAGAQWRWIPQSTLELEAQFVSQDLKSVPGVTEESNSDFRILARASWWFFSRFGR